MKHWKKYLLAPALVLTLSVPVTAYAELTRPLPPPPKTIVPPKVTNNSAVNEVNKFIHELNKIRAKGEITQKQFMDELLKWLKSQPAKDKK